MKEVTLDVLFGYLIMNIQNHEVVSTIVEYLHDQSSSDDQKSVDMTSFINLYAQYLISPELITVERLVVELMKIYDHEGYAQGGPASPDYEPDDESDGESDDSLSSSDEESDFEEIND